MKSIRSVADLAINGAPPAFPEPIHVGRPNIGSRDEFVEYVDAIFERKWLTNDGPLVQELERKIADYHGVKHCVAMANGTVALEIAIRALGFRDEVVVPSYTFIATVHALHWQAITPVFADIDPDTHSLDPEAVWRMITPKTTGIIGVHLWGRAAPVAALEAIAREYGLGLIFDAAHAFACTHEGKMIGGFGDCEVMSFHATKLFNTFEGGAVLTDRDDLAEKMRLMRNFGFRGLDNVIYPGTNGKMSEIAAAMGLVNLKNLEQVRAANKRNFDIYRQRLSGVAGLSVLSYNPSEQNNFQYVVLELGEDCPVGRDYLVEALHAENVRARRYFWPGCHRMLPYRELYPSSGHHLHHTELVAGRVVVLPTGISLSPEDVEQVCDVVTALIELA